MKASRRTFATSLTAVALGMSLYAAPAFAQNTIEVGVLHSLSGTMAISETVLKDTVLMAIAEINAKGGVLGKKLEPVVGHLGRVEFVDDGQGEPPPAQAGVHRRDQGRRSVPVPRRVLGSAAVALPQRASVTDRTCPCCVD